MATYNVAAVSTGADTDNLFCPTGVVYPDCEAPAATHLPSPYKSEDLCLHDALNRFQRQYGKKLTELLVGDTVWLFALPSDSQLLSVGYRADNVNGLVGNIVTKNGADLTGTSHAALACVASTAAGLPNGVGSVANRRVHIPTVAPYNGLVDYVGLTITALPPTWLTCPVVPDICFTANWVNHLTSHDRPNL